ncbi:MAG: flagellar biosynthesis protein FlhB, partial [Acidiferrobacterales bacterium]
MESDRGQERTESATPKRLREAREKGQVTRSRDLNTMMLMLATAGGMLFMGTSLLGGLGDLMRTSLHLTRSTIFDSSAGPQMFLHAVVAMLLRFAPLVLITVFAAVLAPLALGGWSFSAEALGFKWDRLNPIQGFGRILSLRSLMELLKSLAKFVLLAAIASALLWHKSGVILGLGSEPLDVALPHLAHLLGWALITLCFGLVAIAAIDVPFQIWDHARDMKMTRQEVRDEFKETDGRPEVKAQIRRMQREMSKRRMMAEVPKADVIVTNPTHYAVALRYDQSRMRAPRVVAKGADLIAERIRKVGAEHRVAILSAPPLARALYFSTDLGREIPVGLYLAVAKVLAYVYQLRSRGAEPGSEPIPDLE